MEPHDWHIYLKHLMKDDNVHAWLSLPSNIESNSFWCCESLLATWGSGEEVFQQLGPRR